MTATAPQTVRRVSAFTSISSPAAAFAPPTMVPTERPSMVPLQKWVRASVNHRSHVTLGRWPSVSPSPSLSSGSWVAHGARIVPTVRLVTLAEVLGDYRFQQKS